MIVICRNMRVNVNVVSFIAILFGDRVTGSNSLEYSDYTYLIQEPSLQVNLPMPHTDRVKLTADPDSRPQTLSSRVHSQVPNG